MRLQLKFILAIFSVGFALVSCNKNKSELRIHLTDAPGDFEKVLVDVQEVWVKTNKENTGWLLMNTQKGIYDLLQLQNGVDTMLATGTLPQSTVKELRLVLGENNSVQVDSVNYPLTIPSGAESGLKIKFEKPIQTDIENLTIDFDAKESIKKEGSKEYKLIPVLRVKS